MSKNKKNNELNLEYDILHEFGLDKLRQTPRIILQHPIIAMIENMDRSWLTDKEKKSKVEKHSLPCSLKIRKIKEKRPASLRKRSFFLYFSDF